jgi:hypothetical protein
MFYSELDIQYLLGILQVPELSRLSSHYTISFFMLCCRIQSSLVYFFAEMLLLLNSLRTEAALRKLQRVMKLTQKSKDIENTGTTCKFIQRPFQQLPML